MAVQATTITPDSNHTAVDRFAGFSIREDASSTAVIEFRKFEVTGQVIFIVALASGESVSIVLSDIITSEGGVYVKEVSGSIEGVVYQDV